MFLKLFYVGHDFFVVINTTHAIMFLNQTKEPKNGI